MFITYLLLITVGFAGLFLVYKSIHPGSAAVIKDRLTSMSPGQTGKPPVRALEELELSRPFQDRVLKPLLASMARVTRKISPGTTREKTEQRLAQAGNPRGLNVESFYGLKGMVAVVAVVVSVLVMYLNPMPGTVPYPPDAPASALEWGVIALVLGFFFPDMWIYDERKRRQKRIQKALPDTVDIIAISVEAGLGFDASVQRVASKSK